MSGKVSCGTKKGQHCDIRLIEIETACELYQEMTPEVSGGIVLTRCLFCDTKHRAKQAILCARGKMPTRATILDLARLKFFAGVMMYLKVPLCGRSYQGPVITAIRIMLARHN